MAFNFGKFLRELFGKTRVIQPPVVLPVVFFYVQNREGQGIAGATVTLTLDNGSPPIVLLSDANGLVSYQTTVIGVGVNVKIEATGYITAGSRRLVPRVSSYGPLPEWPSVTVLTSVPVILKPAFTRAQLMDIQTDLMIWCPEVKPTYDANGWDAELQFHRIDDRGQAARGIEAGWVWCTVIANYSAEKRQVIYRRCKEDGMTHFALHVGSMGPGTGYHGLMPVSQEMSDNYGEMMNIVHKELLAHGLIPVCAGVAPGVPPAAGFDASQVLVAMSDWDNSAEAAGRIKAIAEAFPQALLFYELPEGEIYPKPCADDPVKPTANNGGAWIRGIQQRYPNFVGVIYEVNHPDGLEANVKQLTTAHAWWRDVIENQGEIDTYWKFWDNLGKDDARAYNDQLKSRCSWLQGTMSSWTYHAAPVETSEDTNISSAVGDMIPVSSITAVGGNKDFLTWPATGKITRLELRTTGIHVEFSNKDGGNRWPDIPFGAPGDSLQYSMGVVACVEGRWYAAAPIQCWHTQDESGGQIQLQDVMDGTGRGQLSANWWYDQRWAPLQGHNPKPGEMIGFFVAAGNVRDGDSPLHERSNIVMFALPPSGVAQTFTWVL